jgi:UDP-N-acetylglucosamine--N-acetylmuramyl-(pentapeptide) pyrophosphoryl-undecaprenol N-acetylglucosamine transferase
MHVLIMAGGTGGHIFPALAVAKKLQQQGHTVHWLGSRAGMEAGITAANAIPIHFISIGGIRGKGLATKLLAPWRLYVALLQSLVIMLKFKPDVVLGMGGYVTGPAGLAAWILRKRLVIHEQNAIAGMTNQILARFSYRVLEGFPRSFPSKITAQLTGNPVREDFAKLLPPEKRAPRVSNTGLKILVVGGSGGARTLNNTLPQVLKTWPTDKLKPTLWHQAGKKQISEARQAYQSIGIDLQASNVKLVDFIQDMPNAFMWADIVVCRAGALTIAEIAAAGVASILIPYPYAVDDHQTKNAEYLTQANAAIIIQERDLTVDKLRELLVDFTDNPVKLSNMARAAYTLAQPKALDLVVAGCVGA